MGGTIIFIEFTQVCDRHILEGAMASFGLRGYVCKAVILSGTILIAGCRSSEKEQSDYGISGKIAGQALSATEVWDIMDKTPFPATAVPQMVCTAWYESGWHTESININRNKSTDFGLLQINSINWPWCKVSKSGLADPSVNAKCGLKIFKSQGLKAWYGYRAHANACNSYVYGKALKLFDTDLQSEPTPELIVEKILAMKGMPQVPVHIEKKFVAMLRRNSDGDGTDAAWFASQEPDNSVWNHDESDTSIVNTTTDDEPLPAELAELIASRYIPKLIAELKKMTNQEVPVEE
jgi:lysozyme C